MLRHGEASLRSDKPGCIAAKAKDSASSKCQPNKLLTKTKGSTIKAGESTLPFPSESQRVCLDKSACNKNSRKHGRGPMRHIGLRPGVINLQPRMRVIIPNIDSRDDQPVIKASTDDSRVSARLGMMVFWVLALQRHEQEKSPVLTYGVCERTRSALSL